ncbi:unnamed protein product [Ranitomeya imitator]|uniref:Cytochrome P450 n=1 Tax=Ranitomeya imitator TaxID=111125 RepID=A0ABN9M0L7_9NEOB|nr:unnamed protein product [Ranitomeya imitator]
MVHRFTLAQASTDLNGQRHRLIQTSRYRKSHHDILKGFRETFSENSCERTFIPLILFPFIRPFLEGLNINFFPKDCLNFYMNAVTSFKEKRMKGDHSGRVDFLQLMLDSRVEDANGLNKEQKALTDTEIMAQSLVFILAGFETTSLTLTYVFHNLAIHPDVQKKLQEEVDSYLPNKILRKMNYILNGGSDRYSVKKIEKTKHHTPSCPFGDGPRNCIGMRFAMLSMKVAITAILQHFTCRPCKDTLVR